MGFYDIRCGVSGVSLKSASTCFILLHERGDRYLPLWYPIVGVYDRLGAIEGPRGPGLEEHLAFLEPLDAALTRLIGLKRLRHDGDQPWHDTSVFQALEPNRNITKLDEGELRYALVHATIAEGVADEHHARFGALSEPALLEAAFGGLERFEGYGGSLDIEPGERRSRGLRTLAALRWWFERREGSRGSWEPADDFGQHYDDDERRFLAEARETLAPYPAIAARLDQIVREHPVPEVFGGVSG